MPRATKGAGKSRHDPLLVQLDEDEVAAKYGRISEPGKRKKSRKSQSNDEENGEVDLFICHVNTPVDHSNRSYWTRGRRGASSS
jgi:hypothetical protein